MGPIVVWALVAGTFFDPRKTVQAAGGFDEEFARIDGVRATHGNNHVPLVARHFRKDRAAMLAVLNLGATSADGSVLQLLDYMREHTRMTGDHIPTGSGSMTSSAGRSCGEEL